MNHIKSVSGLLQSHEGPTIAYLTTLAAFLEMSCANFVRKRPGIPLSSTWGQHTCMYVAAAAVSLVSAAVKPSGPCHGRCLLEENGAIEIPANLSNTTTSLDGPSANLTDPSQPISSSDVVPVDSGTPSDSNNNSSAFGYSPSPILNCPCNCTYVSAACCLSRTVWEDASQQIQMDPLPANATISCDSGTGKWVNKTSESTPSKIDPVGFIGLGSVQWTANTVPSDKGEGTQP